ncbi:MAG TPA: (2Fe-2S)-binding protein [Rhizomicrobium sp.]|jgi:bacterioferritin-associated ferredoxin
MIVCVCNRLGEARIRAAITCGAETPEQVYAGCGVERNCGQCQETIEEMLDEADAAKSLQKAA